MKDVNKFHISVTIRTCTPEGERKSYDYSTTYEGDPVKLDISVIIDGWFIENSIDKKIMRGFSAYVDKIEDDLMLPYGGMY